MFNTFSLQRMEDPSPLTDMVENCSKKRDLGEYNINSSKKNTCENWINEYQIG